MICYVPGAVLIFYPFPTVHCLQMSLASYSFLAFPLIILCSFIYLLWYATVSRFSGIVQHCFSLYGNVAN